MTDKGRVLIVDDDSKSRRILELILGSMGFQSMAAHDGEEALDILSEDPYFDLIITDVMMPNMTGFDLVKKLRGFAETKKIPVIAISAFHDWKGARQEHDLDVDGFLMKPIVRESLEKEIRKLIKY